MSARPQRLRATTVILIAVAGAAGVARANPTEEVFGLSARAKAMGGAGTALSVDFAAVYYNPAGLAFCPTDAASVGYTRTHHALAVQGAPAELDAAPIADRNLVNLGFCVHLPLRLSFGIHAGLGLDSPMVLYQQSIDERPRWVMHDDRLDGLSLMVGGAWQLLDQLAVGLTLSILAHSRMVLDNRVPAVSAELVRNDLRWELQPTAALAGGVRWQPSDRWAVGVTYRGALYHRLEVDAVTRMDVSGVAIDVGMLLESVMWYAPQQLAAGLTVRPLASVTLAADLTWYDWSAFVGPFVVATPKDDSPVAQTLNYPPREAPAFHDVVVPRLGAEWLVGEAVALRAGYGFRATPAPVPGGVGNLLDGDVHHVSLGGGWRWCPPPPPAGHGQGLIALRADLSAGLGLLTERRAEKSAALQLRDYRYGGWFFDAGLQLTAEY